MSQGSWMSGGSPCHVAGALADGDIGARDVHPRADEYSVGDGVAHRHVVEGAIHPYVPNRGESGQQGHPCVGDGRVGSLHRGSLDDIEGLRIGEVGQVSVAIDQAGQHRHVRQVDHFCAVGNWYRGAYGFDLLAADQDDLIGQILSPHHVDEVSGANGDEGLRSLRGRWGLRGPGAARDG
jgi:hypothetical protein